MRGPAVVQSTRDVPEHPLFVQPNASLPEHVELEVSSGEHVFPSMVHGSTPRARPAGPAHSSRTATFAVVPHAEVLPVGTATHSWRPAGNTQRSTSPQD